MAAPVIDVHTHMMSKEYINVIRKYGEQGGEYSIQTIVGGQEAIHKNGAAFTTLYPEMVDYDLRVKNCDKAGVDISIVSLTCPSVYWGGKELSVSTTKMMNDHMRDAQASHPDRVRYFATLPWQYPEESVKELARAVDEGGAIGVMVLANIAGEQLIEEKFAPIWEAIDKRSLPVLVHPTPPPGQDQMGMKLYNKNPGVGFMFDTTLCIANMLADGFFEKYRNLKIIASHGGATVPYLIARWDRCYECIPPCRTGAPEKPSTYMTSMYVDGVVFNVGALSLALDCVGDNNVMYGSDYPHNIGDMAGCLSRVHSLQTSQIDKVRGLNAMRIFKI